MSITYNTASLAMHSGAALFGPENLQAKYVCTDSRRISFPSESLFVAIVTSRRDGHDFLKEAWDLGVRIFLVRELPLHHSSEYEDSAFLLVEDTLIALQRLAQWHRKQFQFPVLGITGSNGKTIVKEWLNQLAGSHLRVVRSPRSYNSQLGAPLSLWLLQPDYDFAIVEAGISRPGEMERLASIIDPDWAVVTNIGAAHDDGFESRTQKWQEKCLLICNASWALLRHRDVQNYGRPAMKQESVLETWGEHKDCQYRVEYFQQGKSATQIKLHSAGNVFSFVVPFTEEAGIENAIICACLAIRLQLPADQWTTSMQLLTPVGMRLELKRGMNQCTIIDDSYSNDLSSLGIALDYLAQQAEGTRTLILSDLGHAAGDKAKGDYRAVARLIMHHKIDRLITIGTEIGGLGLEGDGSPAERRHYKDTAALLQDLPRLHFQFETILVKGAREFRFEKLVTALEVQSHQTRLEINLSALEQNLAYFRSRLLPGTRLMVMVKAFGYGSGDAEVAKVLQYGKVDYLGVAYADEGAALRKAGIHLPIMVLNTEPEAFPTIERFNLEPELYSFDLLDSYGAFCRQQGIQPAAVHVKLDTGMHRLGFLPHEMEALASRLRQYPELQVKSVFTHLVASEEEAADAFTQKQLQQFEAASNQLESLLGSGFIRHAANSAAILRHPSALYDMVRLGIGLYGGTKGTVPVMRLVTTVAQVKKVAAGQTVGYGLKAVMQRDSVIAVVRIGYADGYHRLLGNGRGKMFVRQQYAPTAGNVCMDMTMLDVTDIPGVREGDTVEVFGFHPTIADLAAWGHTIPYEIMTSVGQRVKRVYVRD